MVFRRQIEPRCAYCIHGEQIEEDRVLCIRKGVSSPGGSCPAFAYDPFRRVPPRPAQPDFSSLKDEDFSLE